MDDLTEQLSGVGALAEPVRRSLYRYVVAQPGPVSRDQVVEGVQLPRHTVKFHLDRLVEAGLLEVEFRRLTGRSGPGAGRPSKLYRRSARQWSVSLPERRYDLAADVLAGAVERSLATATPVAETVAEVARDTGRRIGTEHRRQPGASAADPLLTTGEVLASHGYEPVVDDHDLCLTNCPFDRLAGEHTALVCGLNRDLIQGLLDGLGAELTARLCPEPGLCCVRVAAPA